MGAFGGGPRVNPDTSIALSNLARAHTRRLSPIEAFVSLKLLQPIRAEYLCPLRQLWQSLQLKQFEGVAGKRSRRVSLNFAVESSWGDLNAFHEIGHKKLRTVPVKNSLIKNSKHNNRVESTIPRNRKVSKNYGYHVGVHINIGNAECERRRHRERWPTLVFSELQHNYKIWF